MSDNRRYVECYDCGTWEEQPEDQARHKFEQFTHLFQEKFKCNTCSSVVEAEIIQCDGNDNLGTGTETEDKESG